MEHMNMAEPLILENVLERGRDGGPEHSGAGAGRTRSEPPHLVLLLFSTYDATNIREPQKLLFSS